MINLVFNMNYKKFSDCFSNVKDFNLSGKSAHSHLANKQRKKYLNKDLASYVYAKKAGVMPVSYTHLTLPTKA